MRDIIVANWGWITYLVMLAVPLLVGLLTKTIWHPLLKFGLLVGLSAVAAVVRMEVGDLPWSAAEVAPFMASLVAAAEAYYMLFVKSVPAVQQWLDSHLVK